MGISLVQDNRGLWLGRGLLGLLLVASPLLARAQQARAPLTPASIQFTTPPVPADLPTQAAASTPGVAPAPSNPMVTGSPNICREALNDFEREFRQVRTKIPYFDEHWTIDADGRFTPLGRQIQDWQASSGMRAEAPYRREGDRIIFTREVGAVPETATRAGNTPFTAQAILVLDEQGRIRNLEVNHRHPQTTGPSMVRSMTFEYRNNQCRPQVFNTRGFDLSSLTLVADFALCRELDEYIRANPGILQCRCGTDAANAAVQRVLDQHNVKPEDLLRLGEEAEGAPRNRSVTVRPAIRQLPNPTGRDYTQERLSWERTAHESRGRLSAILSRSMNHAFEQLEQCGRLNSGQLIFEQDRRGAR